jgi:hypothetical protein
MSHGFKNIINEAQYDCRTNHFYGDVCFSFVAIYGKTDHGGNECKKNEACAVRQQLMQRQLIGFQRDFIFVLYSVDFVQAVDVVFARRTG